MALDVGALSLHATHQDLLWATQLLASSWHKWQAAAWEKKDGSRSPCHSWYWDLRSSYSTQD